MSESMRPRPAATLVILRDSRSGVEVLLTRRPASMRFMGGATVFPATEIPTGKIASVRDPQGAVFCLYEGHFDD